MILYLPLVQLKGNNFDKMAWSQFLEVKIPASAIKKHQGKHFELYKLTESFDNEEGTSKPATCLWKDHQPGQKKPFNNK